MKKYFFTGLVTLLPLAVTFWVLRFFLNLLTKPFTGVIKFFASKFSFASTEVVHTISQIIVLIGLVIAIFLLGFFARKIFFSQLIRLGDRILAKIPLINKIYKTSKEIVEALLGDKEKSFQQVVMLHFPNEECFCLGLIAKKAPKTCSDHRKGELFSIFVPTTPNPSTGFMLLAEQKDLIYLNMKPEDALKYVVSCAVIQPESQ